MSNWPQKIEKVEKRTCKVITKSGNRGTGFIIQYDCERIVMATAWHVIRELWSEEDKFARYVKLITASGSAIIEAHAVGVARLGPEEVDTGIVWIGKALPSDVVNEILITIAESGIDAGLLDLSGGGGLIKASDKWETNLSGEPMSFLSREDIVKGMDVGWLGYPSVANESPCFFSGVISGYCSFSKLYLIDGTSIRGQSGGPVFDENGHILGIVSKYLGPDKDTMAGLLGAVPIINLEKIVKAGINAE